MNKSITMLISNLWTIGSFLAPDNLSRFMMIGLGAMWLVWFAIQPNE